MVAENNPQAVFKKAAKEYDNMIYLVTTMYDNVFSQIADFTISKETILGELDCFLQAILLKIAISDARFSGIEIEYIKKITDYADIFYDQDLANFTNSNKKTLTEISQIADKFLKEIPTALQMAVHVDMSSQHKTDCTEKLIGAVLEVATGLSLIDGKTSNIEKENLLISLSPTLEFLKQNGLLTDEIENSIESEKLPDEETYLSKTELTELTCEKVEDFGDLKRHIAKALLYIEVKRDDSVGSGTGFLIHPSGYCITCYHVIKEAKEIIARLQLEGKDGPSIFVPAQPVAYCTEEDIALLKIDGERLPYMKMASSPIKMDEGTDICLFGYPFGVDLADSKHLLQYTLTKGSISSCQMKRGIERVMVDISAKAGNSGGPVVSLKTGEVLGILLGSHIRGRDSFTEEMNYMRPIHYIWDKFTK